MAHHFGLDPSIQPTPPVALGAYEMTPLEVATGYTILANEGVRTEPMFIRNVVNAQGDSLEQNAIQSRRALAPRVASPVAHTMEDVIQPATRAPPRPRRFHAPPPRKTSTSLVGRAVGDP